MSAGLDVTARIGGAQQDEMVGPVRAVLVMATHQVPRDPRSPRWRGLEGEQHRSLARGTTVGLEPLPIVERRPRQEPVGDVEDL